MSAPEYKEPWINCNTHIDDCEGITFMRCWPYEYERIRPEFVKRAVLCVNILQGIADETLEEWYRDIMLNKRQIATVIKLDSSAHTVEDHA